MSSGRFLSWRQVDRKHAQPVEEVQREAVLLNGVGQILVRRRNKPDVDALRLAAAESLELALLQHAE